MLLVLDNKSSSKKKEVIVRDQVKMIMIPYFQIIIDMVAMEELEARKAIIHLLRWPWFNLKESQHN
jgi:hypothetical protein